MFKKILVAIDGSQSAEHALNFGLDLAKKYSAEVLIATVIDSPNSSLVAKGMFYAPNTTEDYLNKLRKFHQKILLDALNRSKKNNPKLKVTTKLLQGDLQIKLLKQLGKAPLTLL